eukprot:Clim_evm76s218 gene=Clim_evmTU76s218
MFRQVSSVVSHRGAIRIASRHPTAGLINRSRCVTPVLLHCWNESLFAGSKRSNHQYAPFRGVKKGRRVSVTLRKAIYDIQQGTKTGDFDMVESLVRGLKLGEEDGDTMVRETWQPWLYMTSHYAPQKLIDTEWNEYLAWCSEKGLEPLNSDHMLYVKALSRLGRLNDAFEYLENYEKALETDGKRTDGKHKLQARHFGAILESVCDRGEWDLIVEAYERIHSYNLEPLEKHFMVMFDAAMQPNAPKTYKQQILHLILQDLRQTYVYGLTKPLYHQVADFLLDAAIPPAVVFGEDNVVQPDKYSVRHTTITNQGICRNCNQPLERAYMSTDEKAKLLNEIETMMQLDDVHQTHMAHLRVFHEHLRDYGPFNAIVDGMNVGYETMRANHQRPNSSKIFRQIDWSWDRIADCADALLRRKLFPLILVKNHTIQPFRKLLPQQYCDQMDRYLDSDRKRRIPNIYSSDRDYERAAEIVTELMNRHMLFPIPDQASDDFWILFAAVQESSDVVFVSNDQMRDHRQMLSPQGVSALRKWQRIHQCFHKALIPSGVQLYPPFDYDTQIQSDKYGTIHIPPALISADDFHADMVNAPSRTVGDRNLPQNKRTSWLCVEPRTRDGTAVLDLKPLDALDVHNEKVKGEDTN